MSDFLLWQMVNQKAMGLKGNIIVALEAYIRRTGKYANVVGVNQADLGDEKIECVGIEVQVDEKVLPGTLLIGRKNQEGLKEKK
ncbi:MAG: hypothetical protein CVU43_04620 [Chloroflexi bacterium HGW-Chloroflexi-5]|jgi:hypothetical protein|nr:MAG: hypothetical protein CVU43_04620 [Chloroflexi bacterium HGW-Chloroflexi-5]